jgi:hypothetical protein
VRGSGSPLKRVWKILVRRPGEEATGVGSDWRGRNPTDAEEGGEDQEDDRTADICWGRPFLGGPGAA